ncbi:MAG: PspC domain-containing protein [Candidatus Limnocylindrales bacterium]
MNERLYRSPSDRVIAGVAGGLATWLNVDPSLIRIAWVLLAIFSGGIFVLVYFVMMIVVPLPPPGWIPRPRDTGAWAPPPGADPVQGWAPGGGPGPAQEPGAPTGWNTPPPAWPAPPAGWSAPQVAGNAGLVAGGVLILLGAWFLIDDYVHIDWDLLWPVAVIALGGLLIAGAVRRGR